MPFPIQMKLNYLLYIKRKNWSPDGGHNYLKCPVNSQKKMLPSKAKAYMAVCAPPCMLQKSFGEAKPN